MTETDTGLEQIESRAALLAKAYRRRLWWLWWANIFFVVVPAVLTAAAAVFAALNPPWKVHFIIEMPIASVFAVLAGGLIAIHKVLKCDEHQAECLRLTQTYASIAVAARNALSLPGDKRREEQQRLGSKMESLVETAKVRLPGVFFKKLKTKLK
jgi:hypothetical protein